MTVLVPDDKDKTAKAAVSRAEVAAAAVALVRDLVNTPPRDLPPARFVEVTAAAAEAAGLTVTVWDEERLRSEGFGGIIGVGQGSSRPPRLLRVSYTPARPRATVALVGKGITFDSGGLSLKPAQAMEWMKSDMAGAAAVVATAIGAARLRLPVAVTAWAPLAENMPSGTAIRPSDVLTIYGGRTVEVLNTDAEGRLVLADALVRAAEDDPDLLLDVATLTGAQIVALGTRTSGVMGNDDGLRDAVCAAAATAGELLWPMPLPEELRKGLESKVADISNVPGGERNAGMLVAATFLRDFVRDGLPWAHVDIAGPSFNNGKPWGYTPEGGTGVPVRTLLQLLDDVATAGGITTRAG